MAVFINEIHYDNTGTDAGEFVEIAGTFDTDLIGWSLVLYNGANGSVYDTIALDSFVLAHQSGGIGTAAVTFPENGIQNGAPEGIALVDNLGTVVQFLSYEGAFTAVGGPADGLLSTDIGVSETGATPVGDSLQLVGTGTQYSDFVWAAPSNDTPGLVNLGQLFGSVPEPIINEFLNNHVGTDSEAFVEILGSPNVNYSAYTLLEIEGDASLAGTIDEAVNLGTSDANGLIEISLDAENGTASFLLVKGFSGTVGHDIDTTNSGMADAVVWTSIADSVAVTDGDPGGRAYGGVTLAPFFDGFPSTPGGASRIPNGTDTNTPGDWVRNDFDGAGLPSYLGSPLFGEALNTPGATNMLVLPSISIDDVTIAEGDGGTTSMEFTVALDYAITGGFTVDYSTSDSTAEAPGDYTAAVAQQLTFVGTAGETKTIAIDITTDNTVESDESFFVNLSNVSNSNVTIADGQGEGTIENDDINAKIHEVQGSGATSPLDGLTVEVEGIVVGDYDDVGELVGFYLQEEDTDIDGDPLTSEGIFVFVGGASVDNVSEGDLVRVTGTVNEFFNQTQIDTVTDLQILSSGNSVTPATISLPVVSGSYEEEATHEALEGMLVTFSNTLVVSEFFELARYGQVVLTKDGVPTQFTQVSAPDVAGYAAHQDLVGRSQIILDDTNNLQNFPISVGGDFAYPYPDPGLSLTNYFRGGDSIDGLTGVMSWTWAGSGGTDAWRIRPIEAEDYSFEAENLREATPEDVGGTLKVASFNVQNFFATIDDTVNGARGADSAVEFVRQTDKLVAALTEIDADIVGLVEIENDFAFDGGTALELLVDALNAATAPGTYAYVDPGRAMVDVADFISTAMIYKTATVMMTPGTSVSILDDTLLDVVALSDPAADPGTPVFDGPTTNRAALAATFTEISTGAEVTVSTNLFKSKSSLSPGVNNEDQGDGAGRNNEIREQAARAVAAWLDTNPTGSTTANKLIIGDLNSYAKEDPIALLESAGFTNLTKQFNGSDAYSYRFDGELGTLDYALASAELTSFVTGVTEWHINADEVVLFDFNDGVEDFAEESFERESTALPIYAADAYRSSDHDPIIVGLNLNDAATLELANVVDTLSEGTDVSARIKVADIVVTDNSPVGNTLSLSGADADKFEIVGTVLYLKAGTVLDFEADSQFHVVVEVDDPSIGSGPEDSVPFTFNVLDVNEAPVVDVRFTPSELPEDIDTSARVQVGHIRVYDDALGRADLSLSGADSSLFEIDGFGLFLKAGTALDFETNPVLDVGVVVTDPGIVGPSITITAPVSINVTDVDEALPPSGEPDETGVTKTGGATDDLLIGTTFADQLFGFGGNDTLIGLESDDLLDGGSGDGDVAVFQGSQSNYAISVGPDGVTVTDRRADGQGSDMLVGIETLRFNPDPVDSPDTGTDFELAAFAGAIGITSEQLEVITQFYIGLFDRAPDAFGLLFWATQLANGMTEDAIAQYFIDSPEAVALYGAAPSNEEIVEGAYNNFFDRDADLPGQFFWEELLDLEIITPAGFFTLLDNGAKDGQPDALTLQDQVDIGVYFAAINGLSDVADATASLALYNTSDRSGSLQDAKDLIDGFAVEANAVGTGELVVQLTGVIDDPFV